MSKTKTRFRTVPGEQTVRLSHFRSLLLTLTACFVLPVPLPASVPKPTHPPPAVSVVTPDPSAKPASANPEPATPAWKPQPISRYQGIIDRMPFGRPPPPVAPPPTETPPPPPPPPFLNQLFLSALNRTPGGGLMVGFTDNGAKPLPRNYYLAKGESSENFTVVDASFERETATISKDGISVELKLGKGGTAPIGGGAVPIPPPAPGKTVIAPPRPSLLNRPSAWTNAPSSSLASRLRGAMFNPSQPERWPVPANVKAIDSAISMGIKQESYVERLKKRREELVAKEAASGVTTDKAIDDRTAAAFQAMLRKQNMDMIRRGEGSLGIQLTPEEDQQLVNEGKLPAR